METMELIESWAGWSSIKESQKPEGYEQKLTEVIDLLSNSRRLPPHVHEYMLKEVMTTSDFPYLFGDVLDRQLLAAWKEVEPVWRPFTKVSTVKDFKTAYRFKMSDGDQHLDEVAEKGEYLASSRTETRYSIAVKKYGRQFDVSWETIINDDLGALADTPQRFARAAMRTEHRIITGLYAGDVGTHAGGNLFEVGVNAAATALSIASLETAVSTMNQLVDGNGEPILATPKYLVVCPSLEFTARQILTSANKMWVYRGTTDAGPTAMPTTNVLPQVGLTLIVDPYLPILDTTSDDEAWYLFTSPSDLAVLEAAYLRGHESPEICMKNSDKVTVGGGAMGPMSGDFATDNIIYRVREVFGGAKLDWRGSYMGGYQG